ncbi:MAG: multiheme c-type cytochrome [Limisphaerales bacterium]
MIDGPAETILITIVFAIGGLPLAWPVLRRVAKYSAPLSLLLWLGLSAAVGWGISINTPTTVEEAEVLQRPIVDPEEGYVTADNCASCHPHHHASWHRSYHRTMTQVASPESVHGNFDSFATTIYGRSYELSREGDELWAKWVRPMPAGASEELHRRIELVTGSHHMQIYWTATGKTRELEMLPIVYLKEDGLWVPRRSVFLEPPESGLSEAGRWNQVCIDCHTTRGQQRIRGQHDMDSRVTEFGIACEACHGPAEKHVQLNRDFKRRYVLHRSGERDDSIVNPRHLSPRKSSEVCGQCHVVGGYLPRSDGKSFEPGQDLGEFREVLQFSKPKMIEDIRKRFGEDYLHGLMWNDGEVRVSGREFNGLIDSPCHQHGDEKRMISCQSCHSMHPQDTRPKSLDEWADDQLHPGMRSNAACTQCHSEYRDEPVLVAHTHHAADSAASLCYNCHMPYTSYGLLKAIRSHTISSPNVAKSVETGRPNACNQCHVDRSLGWAAKQLQEWYDIKPPQLSAEEQETSAIVRWSLTGDAAQRALSAWSLGWPNAHEASGTNWIAPHLAILLDDPYDAVRYIAHRSLQRAPGFADFEYDYVSEKAQRSGAAQNVMQFWHQQMIPAPTNATAILIGTNGQYRVDRAAAMLRDRDNRPIIIYE